MNLDKIPHDSVGFGSTVHSKMGTVDDRLSARHAGRCERLSRGIDFHRVTDRRGLLGKEEGTRSTHRGPERHASIRARQARSRVHVTASPIFRVVITPDAPDRRTRRGCAHRAVLLTGFGYGGSSQLRRPSRPPQGGGERSISRPDAASARSGDSPRSTEVPALGRRGRSWRSAVRCPLLRLRPPLRLPGGRSCGRRGVRHSWLSRRRGGRHRRLLLDAGRSAAPAVPLRSTFSAWVDALFPRRRSPPSIPRLVLLCLARRRRRAGREQSSCGRLLRTRASGVALASAGRCGRLRRLRH